MEKKKRDANPIAITSRSFSYNYNDLKKKKKGNLFLAHARIGKDVSFGNYLSIIHHQKTWILRQLITRSSKRLTFR